MVKGLCPEFCRVLSGFGGFWWVLGGFVFYFCHFDFGVVGLGLGE